MGLFQGFVVKRVLVPADGEVGAHYFASATIDTSFRPGDYRLAVPPGVEYVFGAKSDADPARFAPRLEKPEALAFNVDDFLE